MHFVYGETLYFWMHLQNGLKNKLQKFLHISGSRLRPESSTKHCNKQFLHLKKTAIWNLKLLKKIKLKSKFAVIKLMYCYKLK